VYTLHTRYSSFKYFTSLSPQHLQISDINVHETNSFFRPNFQFVSISKQNVLFYPYINMIEMKIKTNLFQTTKEKKTKQNER
jgi:hypothetical protein